MEIEKLSVDELQSSEFSYLSSIFSLAIAVFSLSSAAIIIKLGEQEISPNALVFHRLWISSAIFGFWKLVTHQSGEQDNDDVNRDLSLLAKGANFNSADKRLFWLLLSIGVCSCLSLYCWVWSLTQAGAANATLLRNFTSIFTVFVGWIFLNQRFSYKFLIGMTVAVAGAMLLCLNDWQSTSNTLFGDALALLCAFLYSISLLIVGQLREQLPVTTIMLWRCGIGAVLAFPLLWIDTSSIFPYSTQGWVSIIAFAVICQVVGQGALSYSLKQLSAGLVSVSLLLEPLITAVLAWFFLSEKLTALNGVAFVFILIGIYLAKSTSKVQRHSSRGD